MLNTRSNDFIHAYIQHVTSHKRKNCFVSLREGEGGVAGEGKVVWCTKVSFLG